MKFCIQRSLAQPGKHAKFQQGCRGRKAKGGKAIKAGGQNFQKSFLQLFCASVCALHPSLGILCPISLLLCKLPTVAFVWHHELSQGSPLLEANYQAFRKSTFLHLNSSFKSYHWPKLKPQRLPFELVDLMSPNSYGNVQTWWTFWYVSIFLIKQDKPITELQTLIWYRNQISEAAKMLKFMCSFIW